MSKNNFIDNMFFSTKKEKQKKTVNSIASDLLKVQSDSQVYSAPSITTVSTSPVYKTEVINSSPVYPSQFITTTSPTVYPSQVITTTSPTVYPSYDYSTVTTSLPTLVSPSVSNVVVPSDNYSSRIESAIINSATPLPINNREEITVNGTRGIWVNKDEVSSWSGLLPLAQYNVNNDPNPEVIRKTLNDSSIYTQDIAVRYLRPPTPPPPGELIIREEKSFSAPLAPPIILRQEGFRQVTPEPLILREAPPPPPPVIPSKVVTIKSKSVLPPPRKVILEKLPNLPAKPQSIIIEKWLPYENLRKRRVIYQKSAEDAVLARVKNLIIQWEAPSQINVKREFKNLGVIRANPAEYVRLYGSTLKNSVEIPSYLKGITLPNDWLINSSSYHSSLYELEGDLHALRLIDLNREGLSEYSHYLNRLSDSYTTSTLTTRTVPTYKTTYLTNLSATDQAIYDAFRLIDTDNSGTIDIDEACKLVLRLNSKLGRSYGEREVRDFFEALDVNKDRRLDFNEFKKAFTDIRL